MADTKKKSKALLKGITPKGVAIFPWLTKADTKFKAEGEYRIKLKLEGLPATSLIALIDDAFEKAIALMAEEKAIAVKKIKRADKPYKAETDQEGNETGAYLFTFKQRALITLKDGTTKKIKVDVVDAKKKALPASTPVYGGSEVKVAYEALPFYTAAVGAGLTLRLNAVQVLTLVSAGQRDHGFGEEEGFESDEGDTPTEGEQSKPSGDKEVEDDGSGDF